MKLTDLWKWVPQGWLSIALVLAVAALVWPDFVKAWRYNASLTDEQIVNTEMTMRWMLLPQTKTTAVTFTGPTGTEFVLRAYPDDSLLVTDGKIMKWLPSEQALTDIMAKQPSNKWLLDWLPFATAYAGEPPYRDSEYKQTGPTTFVFFRFWKDGRVERCVYDAAKKTIEHCEEVAKP